jgi:hypothetical protein
VFSMDQVGRKCEKFICLAGLRPHGIDRHAHSSKIASRFIHSARQVKSTQGISETVAYFSELVVGLTSLVVLFVVTVMLLLSLLMTSEDDNKAIVNGKIVLTLSSALVLVVATSAVVSMDR